MTARPLTDGEIALAKIMYGDAIDYARVRVHDHRMRLHPAQPRGRSISFNSHLYMHGTYTGDYSNGTPWQRALFIHEMGHVWQSQNRIKRLLPAAIGLLLRYKFKYAASYFYTLDAKKDLTDYNMEQQASIIEDYFMIRHDRCTWHTGTCRNDCGLIEKMKLYEAVLARFLKNPSYASRKNPHKKHRKNPRPPQP